MFLTRPLAVITALTLLLAGSSAALTLGTETLADFPLDVPPEEPEPDYAPEPLASRENQDEAGEAAIALNAWLEEGDNTALYAGCYLTERNTLRILLTDEAVRADLVAVLAKWEEVLEFNFVPYSMEELENWFELLRGKLETEEPGALYTMSMDQIRNRILVYVHAEHAERVAALAEGLDLGRELEADEESPFIIIPMTEDDLPTYKPEGRVLTSDEAVLEVVPGRDGHHMVVLRATGSEDLSYGAAFYVSRLPAGADPEDEAAWLPVPTRMPDVVIDILYFTAAGETRRYDYDSGLWLLKPGERYRLTKEVRLGDDPEPCLIHAELPEPWRDPAEARWNRRLLLGSLAPELHVEPEETPFYWEPAECVECDQSRALSAYELIAENEAVLDAFLEGERLVLLYADEAAREELVPQLEDWADIIDWQQAFYQAEDLVALAEKVRERMQEAGPCVLWSADYDTRSNRVLIYVHADHLEEAVAAFQEIEPDFAVPEDAPPPMVLVPLKHSDLFWRDAPEGDDGAESGVTLEFVEKTEDGLTLRLRNGSEEEIMFGADFRVERRVQAAGDERWEVVPNTSATYAWNDLLYMLEPGGEREFLVKPGDWLLDPGQVYRVSYTIMLADEDDEEAEVEEPDEDDDDEEDGAEEEDRNLVLHIELLQLTPENWD